MATLMVTVSGQRVSARKGKPVLLVRGQRRKAVRKALNALKILENQEWAENVRSAKNDYEAYFVLGEPNSRFARAHALLKERLEETLAAKV